jgi:3-hydroxybutyryl-CoA dehydrogenase
VCEIVLGERSDPALAEVIKTLLTECGKKAVIVKKDSTRASSAIACKWRWCARRLTSFESGIADVEAVDEVVRSGFGLRLPVYGVFEHQDIVGLDMATAIVDYVASDLYSERRAPQIMRDKVANGELGAKTGRGFYDWSIKDADKVRARRDRFVLDFLQRLASCRVNERILGQLAISTPSTSVTRRGIEVCSGFRLMGAAMQQGPWARYMSDRSVASGKILLMGSASTP